MKCNELQYFISKFYDQTLEEHERRELGVHLGMCRACKQAAQDMLPLFICLEKYLEEDINVEGLSNYILKAVKSSEEIVTKKLTIL
jgi:hypothetical protein